MIKSLTVGAAYTILNASMWLGISIICLSLTAVVPENQEHSLIALTTGTTAFLCLGWKMEHEQRQPCAKELSFIRLIKYGCFSICENGIIWRVARKSNSGDGSLIKTPHTQIGCKDRDGYLHTTFKIGAKDFGCQVHRIVWVYHNGAIPRGLEINHINGIKDDNRIDNLEVVTSSENTRHAFKMGFQSGRRGEDSPMSKLKNKDVLAIRNRYSLGDSYQDIVSSYPVTIGTISQICRRVRWRHL